MKVPIRSTRLYPDGVDGGTGRHVDVGRVRTEEHESSDLCDLRIIVVGCYTTAICAAANPESEENNPLVTLKHAAFGAGITRFWILQALAWLPSIKSLRLFSHYIPNMLASRNPIRPDSARRPKLLSRNTDDDDDDQTMKVISSDGCRLQELARSSLMRVGALALGGRLQLLQMRYWRSACKSSQADCSKVCSCCLASA